MQTRASRQTQSMLPSCRWHKAYSLVPCRLKELQSAGAQSARRERTADICDAPQDLDNAIVDKNFMKAAKLAFKLRTYILPDCTCDFVSACLV